VDFRGHLSKCLKTNSKYEDGLVKVKLHSDDIIVSDTFLIIGTDFLFISPTAPKEDDEKIIGKHCFITEDRNIVHQYELYFNSIWSRIDEEKISAEITNEDEFLRLLA
jgi:hypothetical protein